MWVHEICDWFKHEHQLVDQLEEYTTVHVQCTMLAGSGCIRCITLDLELWRNLYL